MDEPDAEVAGARTIGMKKAPAKEYLAAGLGCFFPDEIFQIKRRDVFRNN